MTEETKLRVTTMNNFFIVAEIKKEIEFPHLLEPSGFYLSLHTPGSAPVLLILKKIIIHPGEILQISVDTTDIQRLPPPYASQCVEDKTPPTEFTSTYSPYTSGETPYSYSRAECIASCVFNHTLEELGCCWPEVIVNETYQSRKIPLCFPGENHDKILEIDKTCTKECRNRCREFLYNWSSKTSIITTHHSKLLKTISKTIDQLKSKTDPQPMMKEAENSSNFVILMMNMESSTFMYSEETARYELEDIFGSIGGNLGLWIGLSILSAFEVFELLTNIVVYFVCKLFKREINI